MKPAIDLPYPQNVIHAAMNNKSYLYNISQITCMDALRQPSERDRDILVRHWKDGLSFKKIAEKDGITITRVAQINCRGLMKIRKYIEKHAHIKPLSERKQLIDSINLKDYPTHIANGASTFDCEKCGKTTHEANGYEAVFIIDEPFDSKQVIKTNSTGFAYLKRRLCKECTYKISPFVIERDGSKCKGIGRKHSLPK